VGVVSLAQDPGLEPVQDLRGTSRLIYLEIAVVLYLTQNVDV
jgi:hypothetical protein